MALPILIGEVEQDYLYTLLTITSTTPPATDLGYLLHKNPARVQMFDLSFGKATVFCGEPLYRVQECVFGVLALESEPVDPRL